MKKFYLGLAIALLFTVLPTKENFAQTVCPASGQKIFNVIGADAQGHLVYSIYIEGFTPNANITLFGSGTQFFSNQSFTDANGAGSIIYNPATITPLTVGTCSLAGCCTQPIPARITCQASVLHIIYPAANGQPPICCVYLNNSVANGDARLFDATQKEISTYSRVDAITNSLGYTCYVYDCTLTPTSIVACGAAGCCSQPVTPAQSALPVSLTAFTANLNTDKKAKLNWTSSIEIGTDKFIVERSDDGTHFSGVAEVKSAGNSAYVRNYTFTDPTYTAFAFYRLKMVDIDGQIAYSKVVYVNNKNGAGIVTRIFPNPFTSEIQLIGINSADLNNKNVQLYNSTGQQMAFRVSGANAISLDANAPVGVYILAVKDQRFKIIKQN